MKIVYDDIILSLQKSGGGSVYWTEIIKNYSETATHIVYDTIKDNFFFKAGLFKNVINNPSRFLSLKRYLPLNYKSNDKFIFHSSYYRYCKDKNAINVNTVHDFTYEYYRKDLKSIVHKLQKRQAVMRSDAIICISENTKQDVLKFYPEYKGIIKVIYNGYDTTSYFYDEKISKSDVILYVGSRQSYKRFDYAVDLMKQLSQYKFIIVGGGDLSQEETALLECKLPGRYEKLGYVTNDDLRVLYNQAFCLLYPSEYEGFGIPLIEAQACGCPVVCQKKSSLPEVAQDACIYISAVDLVADAQKILKLKQHSYHKEMRDKGIENAKRFSWDLCRTEVEKFYADVYSIK